MEAGDPVVGSPMGVAGAQSRSEDEESLGVKDMKRTAAQAFGSGVPKRRSSSRFVFNRASPPHPILLFVRNRNIHSPCIRSIKRKKFDDELVESSLVKSSSRVKGPPVMEPVRCSGIDLASTEKKKVRGTEQREDYSDDPSQKIPPFCVFMLHR